MHELFDQFLVPFQISDKEQCVLLAMKWLQEYMKPRGLTKIMNYKITDMS